MEAGAWTKKVYSRARAHSDWSTGGTEARGAGGDVASAMGHVLGHLKDIGKAGARAACLGVLLLLGGGLRVVGAGNRDGLGVDPRVEPEDLVLVALCGARVDGDPGGVLGRTMMRSLSAWLALTRAESVEMAAVCVSIMTGAV